MSSSPSPESLLAALVAFQDAATLAVDTHHAIRHIAFPVVVLVAAAAFLGVLLHASKNDETVTEKAPTGLLVIGALQALFAVFGLFTHNLVAQSIHFLFFAIPFLFVGLYGSDRRVAAQFTAVMALVNFLCVLGVFNVLGYGTALFDIAPDTAGCVAFFDIKPQLGDAFIRCTAFLNVVALGYLFIAVLQPFAAVFCFALFNDVYRRAGRGGSVAGGPGAGSSAANFGAGDTSNSFGQMQGHNQHHQQGTQLQQMQSSLPQRPLQSTGSQYGVGPVPPAVLQAHQQQQQQQQQQQMGRTASSPAFGGGGFNASPQGGFGGGGAGGRGW